jgi:hypothetical protein
MSHPTDTARPVPARPTAAFRFADSPRLAAYVAASLLLGACAAPQAPMSAGHLRDIRPGSLYAIRTMDAEVLVDRVESVSGDTLHLAAGASLPARHVVGMEVESRDNSEAIRDAGFILGEAAVMALTLVSGAALVLAFDP